ncbi:MAG TPA: hypothetical protein VFK05_30595 [Polyangiaceae bacterium]|nr:hypothetical protein [Polyangiaceae bacterium]
MIAIEVAAVHARRRQSHGDRQVVAGCALDARDRGDRFIGQKPGLGVGSRATPTDGERQRLAQSSTDTVQLPHMAVVALFSRQSRQRPHDPQ